MGQIVIWPADAADKQFVSEMEWECNLQLRIVLCATATTLG